jgi:hypothetical protein
MATTKGSDGFVKIGANTIAEVKDWSLSESADTIDVTTLGETAREKIVGMQSASGSLNAFWDATDTSQGAMTIGAKVTLLLYPAGNDSGDDFATTEVLITEVGVSTSTEGMAERSFSFEATGETLNASSEKVAVVWASIA